MTTVRRDAPAVRVALAVCVVMVLVVTMAPVAGRGRSLNVVPGDDLRYPWAVLNAVVNVVLFLPVGFLAAGARVGLDRWWRVLVVAAVLSGGIEAAQWFGQLGRAADVNDVLANALGAVLGFAGFLAADRVG